MFKFRHNHEALFYTLYPLAVTVLKNFNSEGFAGFFLCILIYTGMSSLPKFFSFLKNIFKSMIQIAFPYFSRGATW